MTAKKRRRLFIVDEPSQIKYSLLLGLSAFVVSLVVSIIFYYHVSSLDELFLSSGLTISPEMTAFLAYQQKLLLVKISAATVIITLVMFLVGVVLSNKISGPVFSIRRSLQEIFNKGDFSARFRIRKHDELKDLVTDLNKAMERLDLEHGRASKK